MGIQQLSELPGPLMFMSYLSIVFLLAFGVLLVLPCRKGCFSSEEKVTLCVLKGYV